VCDLSVKNSLEVTEVSAVTTSESHVVFLSVLTTYLAI
jgi:hypothetical protein